ncbi:hypothetical protein GCM10027610_081720 [Dactylosporangium cerinum]
MVNAATSGSISATATGIATGTLALCTEAVAFSGWREVTRVVPAVGAFGRGVDCGAGAQAACRLALRVESVCPELAEVEHERCELEFGLAGVDF